MVLLKCSIGTNVGNTIGQTTNWVGHGPTHQKLGCLKTRASQSPLDMCLNMAQSPEGIDPIPTAGRQAWPSPTWKPEQASRAASPTREQTLEARKQQSQQFRPDPTLGQAKPWLWPLTGQYNISICIIGVSEEKRKRKSPRKYLKR